MNGTTLSLTVARVKWVCAVTSEELLEISNEFSTGSTPSPVTTYLNSPIITSISQSSPKTLQMPVD
jgi:hypothetical protein